ncbi:MAG: adenine nucleotide alpha hydrolase [Alphaproteobacteria bacterium]
MTENKDERVAPVLAVLDGIGEIAIAVSGGVDSMTLAFLAHRRLPGKATMFHATSPAVPREAGARVRRYADRHGWDLHVISAGEFDDPEYRRNPVNRCYFCKTNLYRAIVFHTHATISSGTNLDDLGDFRPGLRAAAEYGVRHPWVEAGIDKRGVRAIARSFRLDDLAELPAAPCLSSRLETGIAVSAPALDFVYRVERLICEEINPKTVRCRLRHEGTAVELDPGSLTQLLSEEGAALRAAVTRLSERHGYGGEVRFEPYRMGSAFRRSQHHGR